MNEDNAMTVEQQVRKSVVHRFITYQGVAPGVLDKFVDPLVEYILYGTIRKQQDI